MHSRLLSYAPPWMMQRAALSKIGRFVDDDRRIARAGDDRSLAAVQRRSADGRSAGDADQGDIAMLEQCFGRFQRRLGDHADQIVDADFARDRFVESANSFGGNPLARWMRIDDDRVAAGDHADRVAGDRRQACVTGVIAPMTPNGARSMTARPWSPLKHFGFQELDTRRSFAERLQFFDLVFESTDLGFVHLHQPEFVALLDRDAANDVDDSLAIFQRSLAQLLERGTGRGDRRIGIIEDAVLATAQ